jgi:hypothetical protein
VEAYGKRERPRAEVAAEAEELAQVVEDQVAEAEKVAVAKALAVLAEARLEGLGERVSAARAADPAVVELGERVSAARATDPAVVELGERVSAARATDPAVVELGERVSAARAADPVVVELGERAALEAVPAAVGEVAEGLVVNLEAGAPDQVGEAQADPADQVEAMASEVRVAEEERLAVEAQEPSLVNG